MAEIEELVLKISGDTEELKSSLKTATDELKRQSKVMEKAIYGLSKSGVKDLNIFQQAFASMAGYVAGVSVIGAIKTVVSAWGTLFKSLTIDGIAAAADTEAALNDVVGALTRQGNATKNTRKEMDDFASAMQDVSIYGDDAVLTAAALIENITKLDQEALKGATQTAMDLASTLNIDLSTASSILGKALEGNVTTLKRYGISVEQGATQTETFANVMKALAFTQGAAAAKLNTYEGQVALLSNTWQDFTKVFGKLISENPAVLSAMTALNKALKDVGSILDKEAGAWKVFIAETLKPIAVTFNVAAQGALYFASQLNGLKLASAVSELSRLENQQLNNRLEIEKAQKALERGGAGYIYFGKSAKDALPGLQAAAEKLDKLVQKQNAVVVSSGASAEKLDESISMISNSISGLTQSVVAYDTLGAAAGNAENKSKDLGKAVVRLSDEQKAAIAVNEEFAKSLAESFDSGIERNNVYLEEYKFQNEQKLMSDDAYFMAKESMLLDNQAIENQQLDDWRALNLTKDAEYNAAKLALEQKHSLEKQKIIADDAARKKKTDKENYDSAQMFFGNLTALSGTKNKELGAIGKAAAIAQATMSTYQGANKAYAELGAWGIPVAASIVVAGLANVAKIAATPLATGIDSVPGVGNSDNFPAMLQPGERVVPAQTNQDLTKFLQGGQQSGPTINVTVNMSDIFTSDPREMGLKIIETINEAAQANGIQVLGNQFR